MAHYRQMRKDFLDYLEDFVTQDSLIGSTISTQIQEDCIMCQQDIFTK